MSRGHYKRGEGIGERKSELGVRSLIALLLVAGLWGFLTCDGVDPSNQHSLVFLRKGEAYITGEKWRILVTVNVTLLEASYSTLRREVELIQKELAVVATELPDLRSWEEEMRRTVRLVARAGERLERLRSGMLENRAKRGLLNAGGKVIKFVFGNPDADDAEELRKDLRAVEQRQGRALHALEEQVSLSQGVLRRTESMGKRVQRLAKDVGLILKEESVRLDGMKESLERTVVLLNRTAGFSAMTRALELGVVEFLDELEGLTRGVEAVRRGSFTRDIMEPWELQSYVSDISAALPAGMGMVIPEGRVDVGYEIARVKLAATPEGYLAVVDLPLIPLGSEMTAYEVVARPVFHLDSGTAVVAEAEGRVLLVNYEHTQFAILRDQEWASCLVGSIILCPAIVPVLQGTFPSCLIESFLERQLGSDGPCQWKVTSRQFPPVWIWDSYQETWLFSLPRAEVLRVLCHGLGGTGTHEQNVTGSGALKVPEGCTLWTPSYRILPMATDVETRVAHNWTWLEVRLSGIPLLKVFAKWDGEAIREALLELEADSEDNPADVGTWLAVAKLQNHLEQLRWHETEEEKLRDQWIYWWLAAGIGTIFTLAVVGGGAWRLRRKRTTSSEAQPSETSAESPRVRVRYPTDSLSLPEL